MLPLFASTYMAKQMKTMYYSLIRSFNNQIYNWTNMSWTWNCTAYFLDARALLLTGHVIVLCMYAAHACSFNYKSDYSRLLVNFDLVSISIFLQWATITLSWKSFWNDYVALFKINVYLVIDYIIAMDGEIRRNTNFHTQLL